MLISEYVANTLIKGVNLQKVTNAIETQEWTLEKLKYRAKYYTPFLKKAARIRMRRV